MAMVGKTDQLQDVVAYTCRQHYQQSAGLQQIGRHSWKCGMSILEVRVLFLKAVLRNASE